MKVDGELSPHKSLFWRKEVHWRIGDAIDARVVDRNFWCVCRLIKSPVETLGPEPVRRRLYLYLYDRVLAGRRRK